MRTREIAARVIEAQAESIKSSWLKGAGEILHACGWPLNGQMLPDLEADLEVILQDLRALLNDKPDSVRGEYVFFGDAVMSRVDRDTSLVAIPRLYSLLSSRLWYALYQGAPASLTTQEALDMHADVVDALRNLLGSPCGFVRNVEVRLKQQQRKIAEVYNNMLSVQETERRRIARDIHDVLAQALAGARFRAETAIRLLGRSGEMDVQQVALEVTEVKQLVEYTLSHVRDIIFDLRPATLDRFGLRAAVEEYVNRLPDDEVQVSVTGNAKVRLADEQAEVALFRIVQEALANAVKHSGAPAVDVRIDVDQAGTTVVVRDTGRGFDVDEALASSGEGGRHYGLLSMRERTEMIGGRFTVESCRGEGTQISIEVPATAGDLG